MTLVLVTVCIELCGVTILSPNNNIILIERPTSTYWSPVTTFETSIMAFCMQGLPTLLTKNPKKIGIINVLV